MNRLVPLCGLLAALLIADVAAAQGAPVRRPPLSGFLTVDDVNARNGNFSLTYPAFNSGSGVAYRRTYNALSSNDGLFGHGWGSSFETRLVTLSDGRPVIVENGNGALTAYGPPPPGETRIAFEQAVSRAADTPPPHGLGRIAATTKHWIKAALAPERLPVDPRTAFVGQACPEATVRTLSTGWRRTLCDGRVQTFDAAGVLTAYRATAAAPPVRLTWSGRRLVAVTAAGGARLAFDHRPAALTVTDETGDWTAYALDGRRRNIGMTSAKGAPMVFGYDDRSRLVDIGFVDTTHRRVTYDDLGRVSELVGRNGERTTFAYRTAPGGLHETEIARTSASGRRAATIYPFRD